MTRYFIGIELDSTYETHFVPIVYNENDRKYLDIFRKISLCGKFCSNMKAWSEDWTEVPSCEVCARIRRITDRLNGQ